MVRCWFPAQLSPWADVLAQPVLMAVPGADPGLQGGRSGLPCPSTVNLGPLGGTQPPPLAAGSGTGCAPWGPLSLRPAGTAAVIAPWPGHSHFSRHADFIRGTLPRGRVVILVSNRANPCYEKQVSEWCIWLLFLSKPGQTSASWLCFVVPEPCSFLLLSTLPVQEKTLKPEVIARLSLNFLPPLSSLLA